MIKLMLMFWKEILFVVLMAYVTASAADTETKQWKRFAAMIFGLYATAIFMILLMGMEIKVALL